MRQEYEADVIETLESTFGEIENKSSLAEAIMGAARNAAEANIPDYLQDLYYATDGSFLEEVDNDIAVSYTHLDVYKRQQYGYRGTISTSWRSQNEAAANSIAQAYATQLLIWETVIGERDVNFNHVAASGCSNVKDVINAKHPLRNKIFSYYNSMVQSVQNHATIPSFCNKSSGSAKTIELEWNGSKYTTTLTDSNNVLSKYNFKARCR